jgi:hypothetical protein
VGNKPSNRKNRGLSSVDGLDQRLPRRRLRLIRRPNHSAALPIQQFQRGPQLANPPLGGRCIRTFAQGCDYGLDVFVDHALSLYDLAIDFVEQTVRRGSHG